MAIMTVDGVQAAKEPKRGFLARALERVHNVQMQRARAIAKPFLLDLSDQELAEIGYAREEVSRWPTGPRWL